MARKKTNIDEKAAEVPLSSMIDVVFLLLIYFITTQKEVVTEGDLNVSLPAPGSASSENENPPQPLSIDVIRFDQDTDQLGYYGVGDGATMTPSQLLAYLMKIGKLNPDTTVLINCDPNARHKKLVDLLDMCAQAKLTKLNIIELGIPFDPNFKKEERK